MTRHNFGKGKHRCCGSLWQRDKDGRYFFWEKGKFVDVTEEIKDIDEILKDVLDDSENEK